MNEEITLFSESNNDKICKQLGNILHVHSSHIKYNDKTKLYEVPLFNGMASTEINLLNFYGFKIHSIMRISYNKIESYQQDIILNVLRVGEYNK